MPDSPYELGDAGRAWWAWAWATPPAAKWTDADLYVVARRAQLEDDLAALGLADDEVALADLLSEFDMDAVGRVHSALDLLKSQASGKLAIAKEMREIENRLGLNPKSRAELKWQLDEPERGKLDELRARRKKRAGGAAS